MAPQGRGSARSTLTALRDRLTEVIAPVTDRAGVDLERVTVSRVGRRHSVQVIIDRDGGVGLDAIAEVAHAVSAALDAAEAAGAAAVPGEYVLEVSSPGVDRPLTEPRHWRRNIGRLVRVAAGGQTLTGRITATGADGVVLDVDGNPRELPYERLGPGRVQVELRPSDGESGGEDEGEGERT
jgi:ribosome maturation factor RimP